MADAGQAVCSNNQTVELDRIVLRIADVTCAIVSVDPAMKLEVQGAAERFVIDGSDPDITLETRWDDLSTMRPTEGRVFESGALWQMYRGDDTFLFCFTSRVFGPTPYKAARMREDFTRGEVRLHCPYFDSSLALYPLEYPLDELLLTNFLARGRGIEIHAGGVIDSRNQGLLFAGQSGAGKTTMTRLWENDPAVTILSDDRVVLRAVGETIRMYGTPWHGDAKLASPMSAPLARVCLLAHGQRNELRPLAKVEAVGRLFACCFPPFSSAEAVDRTLRFLEQVVNAVPCDELRFVPDERVMDFIGQNGPPESAPADAGVLRPESSHV